VAVPVAVSVNVPSRPPPISGFVDTCTVTAACVWLEAWAGHADIVTVVPVSVAP
jgi:hypothetical protein